MGAETLRTVFSEFEKSKHLKGQELNITQKQSLLILHISSRNTVLLTADFSTSDDLNTKQILSH